MRCKAGTVEFHASCTMLQRAVYASEAMPVGRSQYSEVDTSLFLVDAVCTISVSEL